MGRYVLSPKVFDELEKRHVDPNTNEIQITDSILRVMDTEEVFAHRFEGERYDMGNHLGFLEANIKTALRTPGMREAVIEMVEAAKESTKEFKAK
jgi:UTP--glucose-1-phosphate uridylyltransferase